MLLPTTATTTKQQSKFAQDETRDRYANKKQPQGVALIVMENATSLEYGVESSRSFSAFLNSLVAGLSTGLGALIVFFLKDRSPTSPAISGALGLAAGVMITVSLIDVYVPNMYKATTWLAMFNYTCFLCFGVCAQVLLQQSLPEPDLLDPEEQSSGGDSQKREAQLISITNYQPHVRVGLEVREGKDASEATWAYSGNNTRRA